MKGEVPHSNWSVRCISVPGQDTDLALYVSFEKARFLFGCGEGTQRAFVQKRLSMRGLGAVFLPSGTDAGRGGLAGTIMTAADAGIKEMSVVGPSDTSHFLATLRTAVQRDLIAINPISFPLEATEGEAHKVFESPHMTVHAIALGSRSQPSSSPGAGQSSPSKIPDTSSLPFDPLARSFRPKILDAPHLRQWTDAVVGDMFGKRRKASDISSNPPQSHPMMMGDGTVRFARPDTRYSLPPVSDEEVDTEMVYICQAPDVRGKFDVKKAMALGVPNGPSRGLLVKGEEIEVDDPAVTGGKRIIRPEDCLVGGGPGAVLIVVDCSERNLDRLLSVEYLKRYQPAHLAESAKVHVVAHRVPLLVWQDERYQAWIKAFGPDTHHLFADSEKAAQEAFFRSAAWNTTQLSLLDSSIFPVPYSSTNPTPPAFADNCRALIPNLEVRMHPPAAPVILPPHSKDKPFPTNPNDLEWAKDVLSRESTEYALACEEARQKVQSDPRSAETTTRFGDDITVTTLGTGSAIPSKYRNVSATHLDIPGVGGILLDCGEGSMGQLRRRFGPEGTRKVLEELRMIYISHMHADHHLGLHSILREKVKLGIDGPFFVVGPLSIGMGLSESKAWQHGIDQATLDSVIYLDNFRFTPLPKSQRSPPSSPKLKRQEPLPTTGWPTADIFAAGEDATTRHEAALFKLKETLGLTSMAAPLVEHRGRAFGLVLEHQSGWKIVYSGDTKPCKSLVEAGKDATLLIHEATLEDDKPEMAAQKGHSTFTQAVEVGQQMNASHILLNHFSQRYPKLPKLNLPTNPTSSDGTPSTTGQPDISISFDFMSIKVGEMWKMAHYMDPLSMLFDEAEPEDGDDTIGAVEGDINPSVDSPAPAPNAKGGKKQNGGGGGGGGKGGQKAGSVTTATGPTISKKAQKRAERKAEQKQMDEEKANNEAKAKEEEKERERSPADLPDAKRAKVDTGGHEVLREPVTNAV